MNNKLHIFNFKSKIEYFLNEVLGDGMLWFFVNFNVKQANDRGQTEVILQDILYNRPGTINLVFYFSFKNQISIIISKKIIDTKSAINNISFIFSNVLETANSKNNVKKLAANNVVLLTAKLFKQVLLESSAKCSFYLPSNYNRRYITAAQFIDSVMILNSEKILVQDCVNNSIWALKYFSNTRVGNIRLNLNRNLIFLDFCYNNLYINNIGIFEKTDGIISYLCSIEHYCSTYFARINNLREKLPEEFYGIDLTNLQKKTVFGILKNNMDMFWLEDLKK